MNLIQVLAQLRDDLKLWVANNLRTKVDKEDGKGLSSNDFTTEEKEKLAGLSTDGLASVIYVDESLATKSESDHTHDEYLVEDDISGKADKSYVDDKIDEVKVDSSNKDAVILSEAQRYADESIEEAKIDSSNKDAVVLAEAQREIGEVQTALNELSNRSCISVADSYTGTGTYGSDNPNTLTFDFLPKMIVIGGFDNMGIDARAMWVNGHFTNNWASSTDYSLHDLTNNMVDNGDGTYTLSWYHKSAASGQLNFEGFTYRYVAIG